MKKRVLLTFLMSITITFTISGCGDEDESEKVQITQIPDNPTVINSSFILDPTPGNVENDDALSITGPWFAMRFAGVNPTDRALTIASLNIEIEGRDANGNITTGTWTPTLFNTSVILVAPAGETFELTGTVFVDSLPESANGRYKVLMTFEGWFSRNDDPDTTIDESTQPEESFRKIVSFRTQN